MSTQAQHGPGRTHSPDRFCKVERDYLAKNSEEANGNFRAVVSVSSFTKILAPALRVGWIETADSVMREKFSKRGYIISGGNSAGFSANIAVKPALIGLRIEPAAVTTAAGIDAFLGITCPPKVRPNMLTVGTVRTLLMSRINEDGFAANFAPRAVATK